MPVLASAEGVTGITVGGAIVVALITAVTTNRRQREALRHDREMTDLDDLRKLLDKSAVVLDHAKSARHELKERLWSDGAELGVEPMNDVAKAVEALLVLQARLMVRLGRDDAICRGFDDVLAALRDTWTVVSTLDDEEDPTQERVTDVQKQVDNEDAVFQDAARRCLEAALARARSVPFQLGVVGSPVRLTE